MSLKSGVGASGLPTMTRIASTGRRAFHHLHLVGGDVDQHVAVAEVVRRPSPALHVHADQIRVPGRLLPLQRECRLQALVLLMRGRERFERVADRALRHGIRQPRRQILLLRAARSSCRRSLSGSRSQPSRSAAYCRYANVIRASISGTRSSGNRVPPVVVCDCSRSCSNSATWIARRVEAVTLRIFELLNEVLPLRCRPIAVHPRRREAALLVEACAPPATASSTGDRCRPMAASRPAAPRDVARGRCYRLSFHIPRRQRRGHSK